MNVFLSKTTTLITKKIRHYIDSLFWEKIFGDFIIPIILNRIYKSKKRPAPTPNQVNSILIWTIDSLGDSLWITPSLNALRQLYSNAKITLACNDKVKDIFLMSPFIDELIGIDAETYYSAKGFVKKVDQLKGRKFQLMLVLEAGSRPADKGRMLGKALGVEYLISSFSGHLKKLPDYTLSDNSKINRTYWPNYYLTAIEHLIDGANLTHPILSSGIEVFCNQTDERNVDQLIDALPTRIKSPLPIVILNPCVASYGNLTKKWPIENFVQLGADILKRYRVRILITGTTLESEECELLCKKIRTTHPDVEINSVAGALNIREMVTLLKKVKLIVTGDTGTLHLAEAAHSPVIAIYGATDPELISPKRKNHIVIKEDLPCRPCHKPSDSPPFWPQCVFSSPRCLESILPSRVLSAVDSILSTEKDITRV